MALGEINSGTTIELTAEQLNDIIKQTLLAAHPVGSIYQSVDSTSPEMLFGGTQESIKDVFLLSAGGTYTAGNTGGEANHTLTIGEMPKHGFAVSILAKGWSGWDDDSIDNSEYSTSSYSNPPLYGGNSSNTAHVFMGKTESLGKSQSHNNMPPYLVVYTWKRIA